VTPSFSPSKGEELKLKKMPENKTKQTNLSVDTFLKSVDEKKRNDAYEIIDMMKKITKQEPKMWGPSMIGFGSYHYKYESGREGDMFIAGFSPRKTGMVIYGMGALKNSPDKLKQLGKHKLSGGCLHITKLEDVDTKVLKHHITESVKANKANHKNKS